MFPHQALLSSPVNTNLDTLAICVLWFAFSVRLLFSLVLSFFRVMREKSSEPRPLNDILSPFRLFFENFKQHRCHFYMG